MNVYAYISLLEAFLKLGVAFLILTGFLLECYVNPVLMQMFVETLQ